MAKRTVTLYLDSRSIRVMATTGNNIRMWASAPLEPGLVEDGLVVDEDEVAERISRLFAENDLEKKDIVLGITGLRSFTMAVDLPQLPANILAEALMRECGRVLPVPMEELYVSWMTLPSPRKRTHAFAAAVPRDTADSVLRTVRRAGLTPRVMDIKPLALVTMVGEPNAIIVDVQATEYDIVIVGGNVPQPVRTIPLPSEGLTWDDRLPMIRDDLLRTIEFYDANSPEDSLAPDLPVHVSGELADVPEATDLLSSYVKRPVVQLLPPFWSPPEGSKNYFAVNAGLAVKAAHRSKAVSPVAKLNLLPPAYLPKSFSVTRVAALSGSAAMLGMTIPLVMLLQANSADITEARSRLEQMTAIAEQQKVERRERAKVLVHAEASHSAFTAALETLEMEQGRYNTALRTVVGLLPDTIALRDISHDGETLVVEVESATENEVLHYARVLKARKEFAGITVARMRLTEVNLMRFCLILDVSSGDAVP